MDPETLSRVPEHARAGLQAIAASQPNYGVLAAIPAEHLLQRIADGAMPVEIAQELGVCKSSVSMRFKDDPRYKEAREIGMEVRLDEGLLKIEGAGDDLNLARVREIIQRRREWMAERDFAERWGGKQVITLNQGITMDQALDGMAQKLLAKMRVIEPDAAQQPAQETGDSE